MSIKLGHRGIGRRAREVIRLLVLLAFVGLLALPALANHNNDGARTDPNHVKKLKEALEADDNYVDEETTPLSSREKSWVPAFQSWTKSIVTQMMNQIMQIGAMLDAQNQMETQLLFQKLKAETMKDYQPDTQMCRFGSNVRALAASQARTKTNARALTMAFQRREQMSANTTTGANIVVDLNERLNQFKKIYCDINDANGYLETLCQKTDIIPARVNKDINFTQTVDSRDTLDINFTDANTTPDEEDIMALGKNLFNFYPFTPLDKAFLKEDYAKDDFQDMRSIMAMRSVIYDSFSQMVAMKASGSGFGAPFMHNFLVEMGLEKDEAELFLGESPSYFAQMDVLAHKIYENPVFYTNLYTKPENVERIGVSLQAIRLMQDRDRYEATLRREMLVSLLLELKVRELQENISGGLGNTLNTMVPGR